MIKLKDIIELDKLVYSDTIDKKHQKNIDTETTIIGDVKVPNTPFPENSSKQTHDELKFLLAYNDGVIDRDFSKKGDGILDLFSEYCENNNLDFDKKYFDKLLKESAKTIMTLKYHYNRPRPFQIAEYYDIPDFEIHNLNSAKTPSYPSGHSTQGHLFCLILSEKYPSHYEGFKKLADFISDSRIMARAHFPSDIEFGEKLAHIIKRYVND